MAGETGLTPDDERILAAFHQWGAATIGTGYDRGWTRFAFFAGVRVGRELAAKSAVQARPRCAKCGGSGSFEFVRGSWGDCPACDGRGY